VRRAIIVAWVESRWEATSQRLISASTCEGAVLRLTVHICYANGSYAILCAAVSPIVLRRSSATANMACGVRILHCAWPLMGGVVALIAASAIADEAPRSASAVMSARVDMLVAERWVSANVRPAARSDDSEFCRRASLDLAGVIPTVSEVRAFLADSTADKRARWIDRLLASPRHASHMANTWRRIMLPRGAVSEDLAALAGFEGWLRQQFAENRRYDHVVADLLVATGSPRQNRPTLFYTALGLKPEEIAATTSRIFLGVQIGCAQCHNHPFGHWTQPDFWGFAAFFARLQQPQGPQAQMELIDTVDGEVMLPDTSEPVPPKYLGGELATTPEPEGRRLQLAIWLASRDNPYFARATVNRVWSLMFGRALVEPVDDLDGSNRPSHPELLDELAQYFIDSAFDLRELFRVLANTQAYQRSSRMADDDPPVAPELFARMPIRAMTPDQLYDSLVRATLRPPAQYTEGAMLGRALDSSRLAFLAKFDAGTNTPTEFDSGIPQALTLMNGALVSEAVNLEKSGLLAALDAPFFSNQDRVETLLLATLSRPPRPQELLAMTEHIEHAAARGHSRQAMADILWALVNTAEFQLNH